MKRSIAWVLMHLLLILVVLANLLTGLRIATVHRPDLLSLSPLLPQGNLHDLHFIAGLLLTTLCLAFFAYLLWAKKILESSNKVKKAYIINLLLG